MLRCVTLLIMKMFEMIQMWKRVKKEKKKGNSSYILYFSFSIKHFLNCTFLKSFVMQFIFSKTFIYSLLLEYLTLKSYVFKTYFFEWSKIKNISPQPYNVLNVLTTFWFWEMLERLKLFFLMMFPGQLWKRVLRGN